MHAFDERRRLKWIDGRLERGLTHDDPFSGDPVIEAMCETPDLANYIEEAVKQGRMPETVGREIIQQVAGIDRVLGMYAEG